MKADAKTFASFDKYGLEPFADQLTRYLLVEAEFVEGSFVLSLNSEFGSGKTTFFEMWANKIRAGDDPLEVVYLNGWESDYQGDPLLAIVSSLLNSVEPQKAGGKVEQIKETAGKLCRFGLSIGGDVVQKFAGIDFIKAGQYAEPGGADVGLACFQLYHEKEELFTKLKDLLRDFTDVSSKRIVILVDELDRCRPNYAVEFLETIKHFFDIPGLIFIIGVDKTQLAASAKALFGQELNFDEYYRKFAQRNVTLRVKSHAMTERFCRALVEEYFSGDAFKGRERFPYAKHDHSRTENVVELCTAFSLNARQIHELLRTSAHVLSSTQETTSFLLWGWHIAALFLSALAIKNESFYHRVGRGETSLKEFTAYLKGIGLFYREGRGGFWWAALLYLGAFPEAQATEREEHFIELGVWDSSNKGKDAFPQELSGFWKAYSNHGDWHGSESPFSKIYQILENLKTLADR